MGARAELKTAGLRVEWKQIAASIYPTIIHIKSGKPLGSFNRAPIVGGKFKFVALADELLGHVDWTRSAAKITKDSTAVLAVEELKRRIYAGISFYG